MQWSIKQLNKTNTSLIGGKKILHHLMVIILNFLLSASNSFENADLFLLSLIWLTVTKT